MKKKLCYFIIFYFILVPVFSSNFEIEGLNFISRSDGVIRNVRYDAMTEHIFIVKRVNHSILKRSEQVFIYNFQTGNEQLFFDPFIDSSDLKSGDSISIDSFFALEDSFILIVTERRYDGVNSVAKSVIKKYIVDKNGVLLDTIVLDHSERRLYDQQSTINRNIITDARNDSYYRLNLKDGSKTRYEFPRNIISDFFYTPVMIRGRDEDEIILVYNPASSKKNVGFTEIELSFFSLENEFNMEEILLPSTLIDSVKGNGITNVILSPLKDRIVLNSFAYGLWLYDFKEYKLYPLIVLEKYPTPNEIYIQDWSWNGEKLLMLIGKDIYEIDVNDFIEMYPEGIMMK